MSGSSRVEQKSHHEDHEGQKRENENWNCGADKNPLVNGAGRRSPELIEVVLRRELRELRGERQFSPQG
jgi:hypothetical protein